MEIKDQLELLTLLSRRFAEAGHFDVCSILYSTASALAFGRERALSGFVAEFTKKSLAINEQAEQARRN